jgi:hypothetical protein
VTSSGERRFVNEELDGYFESPHDDSPTCAAMLTIYLDESVDDNNSLWVVGGYLGKKSNWKKYVPLWTKELVPLKSLHMKSLRLNSKQAKKRYGETLKRLGSVPKRCGLIPFAGSVRVNDYKSEVTGSVLEILMIGYAMAIISVIDEILEFLPRNERIEVIFEERTVYAEHMINVMKFIKSLPQHRTSRGKPVLAKWGAIEKSLLTEASDYLCYALLQREIDQTSQKAELTAPILESQPCNHNRRGKEDFLRSIDNVRKVRAMRGKEVLPLNDQIRKAIRNMSEAK